ncbi:MAG: hypothetical protein NPIRA05_15340 [Nitrospirales bacterium]|nr:MAG: hypothetical protein NPIRA05_15340 [Nitrospirales bacterium]
MVEFYGTQFTVVLSTAHSSTACGIDGYRAAVDTATEPGRSYYAFLLAAYMNKTEVSILARDTDCSGDRARIIQIMGH